MLIWPLPLRHRPRLRHLLRRRLWPLMIAWRIIGPCRLHWVLRLPVLPLGWQQQLWGLWARSLLRGGAPLPPPVQWGLVIPHFCQVIVKAQTWHRYGRLWRGPTRPASGCAGPAASTTCNDRGVLIDATCGCIRQHPMLQDDVLLPLLADTELFTSDGCADECVRCCMTLYDRTPLFAVLHPQIVASLGVLKHSIHK